jgi:hypothetical protein
MPRKPTGKPNGRPPIPLVPLSKELPPKEIVMDQVLYWIELQASAEEVAGSFRVSVDTLDRKLREELGMGFAELHKKCMGAGKLSLRRHQFALAQKSASMAIFLGKNWLGQKDNQNSESSPNDKKLDELLGSVKALKQKESDAPVQQTDPVIQ